MIAQALQAKSKINLLPKFFDFLISCFPVIPFPRPKRYYDLKAYSRASTPSQPTGPTVSPAAQVSDVCHCLDCFPYLSPNKSNVIKCRRHVPKVVVPTISPSVSPEPPILVVEPVAGPSGLNGKSYGRKNASPQRSYARKYNIADSDDDYDSDDAVKITKEKSQVLTAPDLQLDWASDSSEDVIFVDNKAEVSLKIIIFFHSSLATFNETNFIIFFFEIFNCSHVLKTQKKLLHLKISKKIIILVKLILIFINLL